MSNYAFYFASLDKSPCKDCYDLPKFAKHPAVTVLRCKSSTKHDALHDLTNKAFRLGFTWDNHMSLIKKVR